MTQSLIELVRAVIVILVMGMTFYNAMIEADRYYAVLEQEGRV